MKRLIPATALAAFAILNAPIRGMTAQALNMSMTFAPNPPRQGTETVTVMLSDGAHKPVSGARVTIATSMPAMSMGGPAVTAAQVRAGVYVAKFTLNFATQWKFEITAKSGTRSITRSYTRTVE